MSIQGRLSLLCLLAGICWLAPEPALAQTTNVSVDSALLSNSTGVQVKAGQLVRITATGNANLDKNNGPYTTDPDGTIVTAPPPGSAAYNFFTSAAAPEGVPPAVGTKKSIVSGGQLTGAPFGALVAAVSPSATCCAGISAYTLIGSKGTYTAPADGFLYLAVNDIDNTRNNSGSYSATISTSNPKIASVEFTQAIQQYQTLDDLKTSLDTNGEPPVPLIAEKLTAMRIYFDAVTDATDVVLAVSGGPEASKTVSLQPNCEPEDQRSHTDGCRSVDFFFAPIDNPTTVTITVSDTAGNQLEQETLTFNTRTTSNIKLKAVKGCVTNPTFAVNGSSDTICGKPKDVVKFASYLEQVAPVDDVTPVDARHKLTGALPGLTAQDYADLDVGLANATNALYTTKDQIADLANNTWTDYLGIYSTKIGDSTGMASGIPSHGAAVPDTFPIFGFDDGPATAAHEVGHTLNLRHTNRFTPPAATSSPGCFALAKDRATYWPFPDNLIQSSAGIYEFGYNAETHTIISAGVDPPDGTFELMSYCYPEWISPLNYERMIATLGGGPTPPVQNPAPAVVKHNEINSGARSGLRPELDGPPTLVTGPYWQISGTIDPTNGVSFNPVFMQNRDGSPDAGTGTYSIEVLGAANQVLYTRNFTPLTAVIDSISGTGPDPAPYFSEWVPVTAGAASFSVLDSNLNTVGALPITGVAPVVTITSPAAGFVGSGEQTISWTAQEPNVTNFTSRMLYSPDGGTTWYEQGDTSNTSETLDFSQLPGSTNALIQVLVSDGANTGSAISAPFTVPKQLPSSVVITNPPDGYAQAAVDAVILRGGAYDADDGFLSGTALSWSSDIQGSLGTGSPLFANLNPGTHKITLTGTDSDGNAVSTSVNVIIGGGRPAVSLSTSSLSTNCISATVSAAVGAQGAPLSQVQYSFDGGVTYTNVALNQLPFSFVVPGSGNINLVARAYDVSDQLMAQSAEIAIPAACVSGTPSVSGGSAQTVVVGAAFANPLAALVTDPNGNPVPNVVVNFTAPGEGASATLSSTSATTGANGIASVTATANSTSGTYNIVAAVPGFSTTAQYTLTNTDFTLAVSAPSGTVKPGSSTTVTVTVTPLSGFNTPVTLSCSGLPDGVTCTNGTSSTDPVSGVITTTLTIAVAKNVKAPKSAQAIDLFLGSGGVFACCLIAGLGRRRRKYLGLVLLVGAASVSCLMAGCGGQNTKPFNATISVTATAGPLHHVIPVDISIK